MPCLGGGTCGPCSTPRGRSNDPSVVALQPVVKLGQLQADDCPKYLAKCLEYALEQQKRQPPDSEAQAEGGAMLLEVFDKVRKRGPSAST